MNEKLINNYRRFRDYTKKLSITCLILGIISYLLFSEYLYIGSLLLVASVSAYIHHIYLKITVKHYENKANSSK